MVPLAQSLAAAEEERQVRWRQLSPCLSHHDAEIVASGAADS